MVAEIMLDKRDPLFLYFCIYAQRLSLQPSSIGVGAVGEMNLVSGKLRWRCSKYPERTTRHHSEFFTWEMGKFSTIHSSYFSEKQKIV